MIYMSVQNKNKNLKHLTIEQVIQKSSLRKVIQNVLPAVSENNKNSFLVQLKSKELNTLDYDLHHHHKKNNLLTNQLYTIMTQTSRTSLSSNSKTKLNQQKLRQENFMKKQRNSETLDPELISIQDNKIKDKAQNKKIGFKKINLNVKDKRKANQFLAQTFLCVKNGSKQSNKQKLALQTQNQNEQGIGIKKVMEQYQLKNYRTQLHFNGQSLNNSVEDKVHKSQNVTDRSHKVFSSESKKKMSNLLLLDKYQSNQNKNFDNQEKNELSKRKTSYNQFQRNKIRKRKFQQKQEKINRILTSKASKLLAKQDKKKYQFLVFNYPGESEESQSKHKRKRIKTTEIEKLRSPSKKAQIQSQQKNKQKQCELTSLKQLHSKIVDNFTNKKNNFLIPQFLKPSLQLFKLQNQKNIDKGQTQKEEVQKFYDQQNNQNKKTQKIEEISSSQQTVDKNQKLVIEQNKEQPIVEITSRKLIPKVKQNEESLQLQKKTIKMNSQTTNTNLKIKNKVFSKRINHFQFVNDQQLCGWKDHNSEKQEPQAYSINFHTQTNDIFQ